jgi:hypothetical protein
MHGSSYGDKKSPQGGAGTLRADVSPKADKLTLAEAGPESTGLFLVRLFALTERVAYFHCLPRYFPLPSKNLVVPPDVTDLPE